MRKRAAESHRRDTTLIWWAIVAATVAIPLTVVPAAKDPFRIPKELEFRALGIIVITMMVATGWKRFADGRWRREQTIVAAVCLWAAIATFFSVNRALSFDSLLTVIFAAVIFLAVCVTAHERTPASLLFVFVPALINAALIVCQALRVWTPFPDSVIIETGLLGNGNDAGAYLLSPAIAALVLAGVSNGLRRVVFALVNASLVAGILATQALSAVIAYAVAVVAFAVIAKREHLRAVAIAVVVAGAVAGLALLARGSALKPMLARITSKTSAMASGNLDVLTSYRLGAFLAAWDMFADHPIVGIGPGVFRFEYFPRRIDVERRYPTLLSGFYSKGENFGEVHNDHLQILAEMGLVGYLIFLSAGVYIASLSFRHVAHNETCTERELISRNLAFPLLCGFTVLAVGQFPMELAAPRLTFIFFGAICCAWADR
ncbi:MAG TPA: O-antigen ligase family protein [Thermoanaerobaculia bacterium]|nr:O-antigen ligase family protein [Thermoanaerobaculia bacterium]